MGLIFSNRVDDYLKLRDNTCIQKINSARLKTNMNCSLFAFEFKSEPFILTLPE